MDCGYRKYVKPQPMRVEPRIDKSCPFAVRPKHVKGARDASRALHSLQGELGLVGLGDLEAVKLPRLEVLVRVHVLLSFHRVDDDDGGL